MSIKGWYIFCLCFLFYNLKLLFDVKYLRSYCMQEDVRWGRNKFLACLAFDQIQDLDDAGLEPKNQNASIEEFIYYCARKIELNLHGIKVPIDLTDKFIFKKHFCFNMNNRQDFERQLIHFLKHNFKLFVYSNEKTPFFFQSFYNKAHLNQSLNHFHFGVLRQLVFEMEYPYSDCVGIRNSFSKDLGYNLFDCLNACLRERDDSLFHLYNAYENFLLDNVEQKQFDLAYIFRRFRMQNRTELSNQALSAVLEECQRQCPGDGCVWESYATATVHFDQEDESNQKEHIHFTEMGYQAYPSTSYFYLQLFGLLSLFTGISVSGSVPKLVEIVFNKLNLDHSQTFKSIFPRFTFGLIVLCYLIYTVKVSEMYNEYETKRTYPNKSVIIDFSMNAEPFGLVICIPIEELMNRSVLDGAQFIAEDEKNYGNYNASIDLEQMTFEQLTNATEPAGIVEKVVLTYAAKEFEAEWYISKRVIFRNGIYVVRGRQIHGLLRCFRVTFHFKQETKFMSIMTIALFKIHLKVNTYASYLLGRNEMFSSSVKMFNPRFSILKVFLRYSPNSLVTNCLEYQEKEQSNVRCRGRGYCLDVCKVREYLRKYQRIPINTVLQRTMFEEYLLPATFFSTKRDTEIEAACNANYSQQACHQEEFRTTLKSNFQYRKSIIELDIYFEKTSIKEIDQSWGKLILNMLNVVSILFGSNVFQLLNTSFSIIRLIFGIKWHHAYRFLFFLLCICGLGLSLFTIFSEIINSELSDSGFMRKLQWMRLPSLVFCLRFDESLIDEHQRLDGDNLRRLTSGLTYESVFRKIAYYNRTHFVDYWFNQTADSPLSFSTFYYFNMKCFSITNSIYYYVKHLYFKNDSYVLRIHLNLELKNPYRKIYVLYNSKEKPQFNEVYTFRIGKVDNYTIDDAGREDFYRVTEMSNAYKYKASLERFDIEVNDKFQVLKSPMRLFCRNEDIFDQDTYVSLIKRKFNNIYHLTTRSIPLLEDGYDFEHYEISESMFEQFYLQVQNKTDHNYPQNSNSLRTVYNFYIQKFIDNAMSEPDFEFGVHFSALKILQTNDDNVANLVQNCFNSLSLWISFTILDLYIYLKKLVAFFVTIRDLLVLLKTKINLTL